MSQGRSFACSVEAQCEGEQICRKKGRNGTANSGTGIFVNERLCICAQILLLISCWRYVLPAVAAAISFKFTIAFPLFSFFIYLFSVNLCVQKKRKKTEFGARRDRLISRYISASGRGPHLFVKAEGLVYDDYIFLVAWEPARKALSLYFYWSTSCT